MRTFYIGIDTGSISVKVALVDDRKKVVKHIYRRMFGKPLPVLAEILEEIGLEFPDARILACGTTGTGGELAAKLAGGQFFNEIVAQSAAVSYLYPRVRTVIEMGGQDSKFILLKPMNGNGAGSVLEDFSMNSACAAGTGSFLDQQASRMGYRIEKEFGEMALKSSHPPRIAGRCSVFAKSDMIHLQQIGTPDYDIAAGLCHAVARSFKSNVAKGKQFIKPVAFVGGVAANIGVVKAFRDELGIDNLIIPEFHKVTGAIGAALSVIDSKEAVAWRGADGIRKHLGKRAFVGGGLAPLMNARNGDRYEVSTHPITQGTEVYIGIDIGSLSTNVVAIDDRLRVVARRYLRTAGRPIDAVTRGLLEIGGEIAGKAAVKGVGTTGSGRYMIADFVGADAVRNEITAQATAAVHFAPDVDTIFEIGGQDSKYISLKNGVVVDFEMNKVCAAGTGSFIEEQAERLELDIKKDFSESAFAAEKPGRFGERCTVFIESDLVAHQQKGSPSSDLAAGLAHSIVRNYLNVVGDRKIGNKILFQGGVAWNEAVVSAFAAITGKKIHVPPQHDVTGAIGAAMIARREMKAKVAGESSFLGFDLRKREYRASTFECKACENVCDISRVKFGNEDAHYYGARCELFEKKKKKRNGLPDLFAEREKLLFGDFADAGQKKKPPSTDKKTVVGIPRALFTWELFPFWRTFLEELGCEVVISAKTNQKITDASMERVTAESCFPIKIIHGHVLNLIEKGVDAVFVPSVITMHRSGDKFKTGTSCPLVQAASYILKAAVDFGEKNVELWEPAIHFHKGEKAVAKELAATGRKLNASPAKVRQAVLAAGKAQNAFFEALRARGREIIDGLGENRKGVVIIARPYNGCDSGLNMDLPRKLKEMGKMAIPMDMLPISEDDIHEENQDMYWRSGQRMLSAAEIVRCNPNLDAIHLSSFKCGPDSFISYHVQKQMMGKPYLHLELDEHSADAGMLTRCEAFFDSLENSGTAGYANRKPLKPHRKNGHKRVLYLPNMCDHAYPLAAALTHCGQETEVLPETTKESLDIAGKFATGKECLPFRIVTGDILAKALSSGFEPERTIFFMPTTGGPCRFGQYNSVIRLFLDRLGYIDTPILTPDSHTAYEAFGQLSKGFRRMAWRGVVAMDRLQKLKHETRPYETVKGATDCGYQTALDIIVKSMRYGGDDIVKRMYDIRDIFRAIPTDRSQKKPVIGVVGEIFVRLHRFSNQDIAGKIEELGGEARIAPFTEWVFYCISSFVSEAGKDGRFKDMLAGAAYRITQTRDEKKLLAPFNRDLQNWHEPAIDEVLRLAKPYVDESFKGEAVLSVGKAIDYVYKGCSGIANILPFSCMPGTVVTALSGKIRKDHGNIPWINIDYDGVEEDTVQSRLEAFMYQAGRYKKEIKKRQ